MFFRSFREVKGESLLWDNWSVGVAILEVIAGTEIVMSIDSYDSAQEILDNCKPYIDPATFNLLNYLMLSGDKVLGEDYIAAYLDQDPLMISKCVRALAKARLTDSRLLRWEGRFHWLFNKDTQHYEKIHEVDRLFLC